MENANDVSQNLQQLRVLLSGIPEIQISSYYVAYS